MRLFKVSLGSIPVEVMENVVPSSLPVLGHGFTDSILPNFQLLSLTEAANASPVGPAPPVRLGDPASVDEDVRLLLLELTSMDADIERLTRPRSRPFNPLRFLGTTMSQEPQQPHRLCLSNVGFQQGTAPAHQDVSIAPLHYKTTYPTINLPLPVTVGYGSPQGSAPVLRGDHTTPSYHPTSVGQDEREFYSTTKPSVPLPVGFRSPQGSRPVFLHGPTCAGRPAVAMPRRVNYTTSRKASSYMGVKGGNKRVCLCRDSMGEICGFTSKPDLVLRHIRRVHFKLG